jgi:hypothetical protein
LLIFANRVASLLSDASASERIRPMEQPNPNPAYWVGYGRPPLSTRFRKGRSGNPRGRPRGSTDIAAILKRALGAPAAPAEDGAPRAVSKLEAMFEQQVDKAAAGDLAALRFLTALPQFAPDSAAAAPPLAESDRKVVAELLIRLECTTPGARHD